MSAIAFRLSFISQQTKFATFRTPKASTGHNAQRNCQCSAIRLAEEADVPSLLAIEDASRPGGNWNVAQVAEELHRDRATVLVNQISENITGWIVTWHVPPDELHILEIAVDHRHRRQGIATSLLQAALGDQYRSNAAVALLEVRASNEGAIALYQKLGFEVVGRRKRFYSDNDEDAILMNCQLPVNAVSIVNK